MAKPLRAKLVLPTVDRERTIQSTVYGALRHACEREAAPLVLATALALDTQGLINNGLMTIGTVEN